MRSGALNAAQNLLQVQLNQYPNSDRLQKQAHRLYRLLQWPDYIGI
jgi:hypothetical protein